MKKISILIFFCAAWMLGIAQNQPWLQRMSNLSENYNTIIADLDTTIDPNDTSEGGRASQYGRWKTYWKDRMGPNSSGSFRSYFDAIRATILNPVCDNSSAYPADWSLIGPISLPEQNNGIVTAVAIDPSNTSVAYAGTNRSGLWRTNDITAVMPVWQNVTDGDRIPGLGVKDILIDPTNPDIIYISTDFYGMGILKTVSGTTANPTWFLTGLSYDPFVAQNLFVSKMLMDPVNNNLIYAVADNKVYKCIPTDHLLPWTDFGPTTSNLHGTDIVFDPSDNDNIIVAGTELWRYNGSWTNLTSSLSNYVSGQVYNIKLSVSGNNIYALYSVSPGPSRYIDISTDGGATWSLHTATNLTGGYFIVSAFVVNNLNANIMYACQDQGVMRKTINGGANFYCASNYWSYQHYYNTSTHADLRDIELVSSSTNGAADVLIVGTDGGVLYSTSSSINTTSNCIALGGPFSCGSLAPPCPIIDWKNANGNGLAITQFYGFDLSEMSSDHVMGGAQDIGIFTHNNSTWNVCAGSNCGISIGDAYKCAIDKQNNLIGYGETNPPFFRKTSTAGQSFTSFTPPPWCNLLNSCPTPDPWNILDRPVEFSPNNTLLMGHLDLFKLNLSNGWDAISNFTTQGVGPGSHMSSFEVAYSNPLVIYAAFEGPTWDASNSIKKKLWKTTNGGTSWTDITGDLPVNYAAISDIAIDPQNPDRVWVTFNGVWTDGSISPPYNGQKRVRFSNDGGTTWADYTKGLTPFGINTIVYERGSDEGLYVGTDVGVFYTNKNLYDADDPLNAGNVGWVCYSDNLPVCDVRELKINYCSQKLRAATYGRGIWESPLAPNSSITETVSTNATWSTNRRLLSDLRVESGATLTITSTINIAAGKKIIVKPGATLTCDGCTLTNGCGLMWKGIEVHGNQALSQAFTGPQGKVILKNNAVIEHAIDAIRVWEPGDYNTTGGIILCSNSMFRNNKRSVEFMPYQNFNAAGYPVGNMSYFVNTTFTVDNQYHGNNDFYAHVTMWYVDGIKFRNCTLENAQTNVPASDLLGYGIYSLDANFTVGPTCDISISNPPPGWVCPASDIHQSLFKGLEYGIYATKTAANRNFSADQSVFENNMAGVYSRAVDDAVITRNVFTIGGNTTLNTTESPFQRGLIINTGSHYRIEENQFLSALPIAPNTVTFGVLIVNTGPENNEVYKNTFDQLHIDNCSRGNNRDNGSPTSGLQFLCNEHIGTIYYDMIIVEDAPVGPDHGIRTFQGDPGTSTSTGNILTHNTLPDGDISNYVQWPITYLWYGSDEQPLYYTPTYVNPSPATNDNLCTSKFSSGHDYPLSAAMIQQLEDDYDENESAYLNVLYNYNQLIDGGNTNALLQEMEISWSADAWTLRNELLSRSPYLSQDVLREAAMTGVLPDAMLLEVCLANPDATGSDAFISFLQEEIPNPMPTYMTDLIMATWGGVTPRTILEGSLASYGHKMAFAGDMLLADILLDTLPPPDSLVYWLDRIQTLNAKYALVETYFQQNGLADAEAVLTSIPDDFTLKPEDEARYGRYVEYFNFRKTVISSGRNLMQLTATEVNQLETFANDANDLPGVMAQNLLCFGYNICKEYNFQLPAGGGGSRMAIFSGDARNFYNEVKVTPNPAVDFAAFTYDLSVMEKQATLTITDLTGRVVQEFTLTEKKGQIIWDTRVVNKGIYLYHIKGDYSDQTRGKILISKH